MKIPLHSRSFWTKDGNQDRKVSEGEGGKVLPVTRWSRQQESDDEGLMMMMMKQSLSIDAVRS